MAYELLDTCLGVPGVSADNCAGWVQAWGSLLALGIAIAVPLILRRHEIADRKRHEQAQAIVVAAELHLQLQQILGVARTVANDMREYSPDKPPMSARLIRDFLDSATIAPIEVLLRIEPADSKAATSIARGFTLLGQVKRAVALLVDVEHPRSASNHLAGLLPKLDGAIEMLTMGQERLARFLLAAEWGERPPPGEPAIEGG